MTYTWKIVNVNKQVLQVFLQDSCLNVVNLKPNALPLLLVIDFLWLVYVFVKRKVSHVELGCCLCFSLLLPILSIQNLCLFVNIIDIFRENVHALFAFLAELMLVKSEKTVKHSYLRQSKTHAMVLKLFFSLFFKQVVNFEIADFWDVNKLNVKNFDLFFLLQEKLVEWLHYIILEWLTV